MQRRCFFNPHRQFPIFYYFQLERSPLGKVTRLIFFTALTSIFMMFYFQIIPTSWDNDIKTDFVVVVVVIFIDQRKYTFTYLHIFTCLVASLLPSLITYLLTYLLTHYQFLDKEMLLNIDWKFLQNHT